MERWSTFEMKMSTNGIHPNVTDSKPSKLFESSAENGATYLVMSENFHME